MKKKTLVIGAIAATTVFAGGWAVAQSVAPGQLRPVRSCVAKPRDGPGMMKGWVRA